MAMKQGIEPIYTMYEEKSCRVPPFGITHLPPSTDVFHPLHRPIEFPSSSTEIHCCLRVLLSVLGSPSGFVILKMRENFSDLTRL